MSFFIGENGYYEGDKVSPDDLEVTQRPSQHHIFNGEDWEVDNTKLIDDLKSQLEAMEQKAIMPRGAREAFIVLCMQQGTIAGLTEPQLYAANPFYKGLKDTDTAAASIRAQIRALTP
jgi:hypothetical protein